MTMYKVEIKKSVLKTLEEIKANKYAYYKEIIEMIDGRLYRLGI